MSPTGEPSPGITRALETLRRYVESTAPDLAPLDLGFESLDRAEQLVLRVLEKRIARPEGGLTAPLITYVGETARERLGGVWAQLEGERGIRRMRGMPARYVFTPVHVIRQFQQGRRRGTLREAVERHDLELQCAKFVEWRAGEASELAALLAQVDGLDFTVASVDRLEPVLAAAGDAGAAGAQARDRVERYLGEVYRRARGGEWRLVEDPVNTSFGRYVIDHFGPKTIAARYLDGRKPGTLLALMKANTSYER